MAIMEAWLPYQTFGWRRQKMDQTGSAYWSAVLGLLGKILAIWFIVSFGFGILFADALNSIKLGRKKLCAGFSV